MTVDEQVEMSQAAIDEFVGERQVGLFVLAREREPYAIPVTYSYHPEERQFYFRLVFYPGSKKRRFLGERPPAQLAVYEEDPPLYRSVIADGRPRRVDSSEVDEVYVERYGEMMRPLFELWREPRDDLEIQLYEFAADSITGRTIDLSGEA